MDHKKSILIADDEASFRKSISFFLEKEGFRVIQCDNGVEAIMAVENERVDLAIIDLKMRNIDGLTAIDSISRLNPSLPVIVITAYADNAILQKLPELVKKVFIKPFEVHEITNCINDLVNQHGNS